MSKRQVPEADNINFKKAVTTMTYFASKLSKSNAVSGAPAGNPG